MNPGFEGLKIISARKMEAGREFQFLEVIGTNVFAKEVVREGVLGIGETRATRKARFGRNY